MTRALETSPDGQWIAARDGRTVTLGPCSPTAAGPLALGPDTFELDSDDADLAFVHGPPIVLLAVVRVGDVTRVSLYQPPEREPATGIELRARARLETTTGGRIVLVTDDRTALSIVRAAGRGLAVHPVDLRVGLVDFAVGIDRAQLVIAQPKRLEVWDGVSGRPMHRLALALELPPPPRLVGAAAGHLWLVQPGSDELVAIRLSDGRPFRQNVGASIASACAHLLSPLVVLGTGRGLVRVHCFAHSALAIEAPWRPGDPIAQLVAGEDVRLVGWTDGATELWSTAISRRAVQPPL